MNKPRPSSADSSSLDDLKSLLLTEERERLAALEAFYDDLSSRLPEGPDFTHSVAAILADALKKAEVADHRRLAGALAPLIVSAIRREIAASRDMMVEALYPITGRLVKTAVSRAFQDLVAQINDRIEQALSVQLWRYRLRALFTGKSVPELLLADSVGGRLETLLLLDQPSGAVLARHPPHLQGNDGQDALIGGLLTAISDLARSAFKDGAADLRTLDFNGRKVLLRASGLYVLVSVYQGLVTSETEKKADRAFMAAVETLVDEPEQDFPRLLAATANDMTSPHQAPRKHTSRIIWIGLALLTLVAGGLWLKRQMERRAIDIALESLINQPPFSTQPITLSARHDDRTIDLRGVVSDADLTQRLQQAAATAAPGYTLAPRMASVEAQANAAKMHSLMSDISALQQQLPQTLREVEQNIASKADKADMAPVPQAIEKLQQALAEQAARLAAAEQAHVRPTPFDVLAQSCARATLLFGNDNDFATPEDAAAMADRLALAMKAAPEASLIITGYADTLGSETANRKVATARAQAAAHLLAERGIAASRLFAVAAPKADSVQTGPGTLARRVEFRAIATRAAP